VQKELTGVEVPVSKFLPDPDIASNAKVLDILAGLESTGNLQAIHGVALSKVIALPDDRRSPGRHVQSHVQRSTGLRRHGRKPGQHGREERARRRHPPFVRIHRTPEGDGGDPLIKAKEEKTVTVEGITPSPYGEVAVLKVKAGPVQDEKYSKNNVIEANVIFKL